MVQKRNNIELEIILALIQEKMHLREIARRVNESPSTVLRKLNELKKESVIDFKKEGKNNVFFIKNGLKSKGYIYSAEHYKLLKLITKYPEMEIILQDIERNVKNGMIILFGSYAKNNAKENSDIDIYIESDDNKLKYKLKGINSKINAKIGKFDLNSLLIKEIIKNHIIIRGIEEFYEKSRFF